MTLASGLIDPWAPAVNDLVAAVENVGMDIQFEGTVIEWRGPAPFFFVPIPPRHCDDIREVAATASYGWGVIPVEAHVGDVRFSTSLFPKDGGYLLPLKDAVRRPLGLSVDDAVTVTMSIRLDLSPRR